MTPDDDRFDDRKKSQEAKYKMDEERRFKIRARRNRLFGQWVAQRLGLADGPAQELTRDIALAGLEARTDAEFVSQVRDRLAGGPAETEEAGLAAELAKFQDEAQRQIAEEFPTALGGDHAPVGDSPHSRK